jgi:DNA-binding transcriptional LysR family regulator
MIAVRIGPDMRMAVVGSPAYFRAHPKPETPQHLTSHNCINMRLPTYGRLFAWEFVRNGRELKVPVEGQTIVNNIGFRLNSALDGLGLAYMPEDQAIPHIADGTADACARQLVPALLWLPSLLSEPPPCIAGFHAAGRYSPLPL